MTPVRTVELVVPEGIDDPLRPSGGNTYDRRVGDALAARGWRVHTREVAGDWPSAGEPARRRLASMMTDLDEGSLVVVDGLLASAAPEVMVPAASRVRLVVLVHLPIGLGHEGDGCRDRDDHRARERAVLGSADAVVTTSEWSRRWVRAAYDLDPGRVHVASPGVDVAEPRSSREGGGGTVTAGSRLLCVGAVTPVKGHDVLVAALARVSDLWWRCVCVGSLTREPDFAAAVRGSARDAGLGHRVVLTGPRTGRELQQAYTAADVLVLASRAETYGMVVTEALAHAVPVLASAAGGVPEALGTTRDGARPGLLTAPGDVGALAEALRCWLTRADLRRGLRAAARERREALTGWDETAGRVGRVLVEVAR